MSSPGQEGDGHTEASPVQGHSDGYRTRASLVQPGEEKAPRDLINVHQQLIGGKEDEDE